MEELVLSSHEIKLAPLSALTIMLTISRWQTDVA